MKVFYIFTVLLTIIVASVTVVVAQDKAVVILENDTGYIMSTEASLKASEPLKKVDIEKYIKDARAFHEENNVAKTIDALEDAAKSLRVHQSHDLKFLIPLVIRDWELRDEYTEDEGDGAIVGLTTASRSFVNDDKLIKISILIDSPVVGEIFAFTAEGDGGASHGVGDYRGYITTFSRSPKKNTLTIVTGQKGIVRIEGFALSRTSAHKIADSLDLDVILEFANK